MLITWWSFLIIVLTIVAVGLIVYDVVVCGDGFYDKGFFGGIMLILLCFFGWGIIFNFADAKTKKEKTHYVHKFVTEKNIILEMPDGSVKTLKDMKYLKKSIKVVKKTTTNTYGSKTVFYVVE